MTNESILKKTLDLLKLETIDRDIFTWTGKNVGFGRIFGGQVMAQCLIAAHRTIESKHSAHSFHSYFLRPGKMDKPITYTVDRIRDGKSFSTRNVKAIQDAEAIFNCSVSFQKREKGLEAQVKMPDVPGPESLISEYENRKIQWDYVGAFPTALSQIQWDYNNTDEIVGGAYFDLTKDEANYSVGVYRRDLSDQPLGHVVQDRAIQYFLDLGLKRYKIGHKPFQTLNSELSQKEKSISEFKSGFGAELVAEPQLKKMK